MIITKTLLIVVIKFLYMHVRFDLIIIKKVILIFAWQLCLTDVRFEYIILVLKIITAEMNWSIREIYNFGYLADDYLENLIV